MSISRKEGPVAQATNRKNCGSFDCADDDKPDRAEDLFSVFLESNLETTKSAPSNSQLLHLCNPVGKPRKAWFVRCFADFRGYRVSGRFAARASSALGQRRTRANCPGPCGATPGAPRPRCHRGRGADPSSRPGDFPDPFRAFAASGELR